MKRIALYLSTIVAVGLLLALFIACNQKTDEVQSPVSVVDGYWYVNGENSGIQADESTESPALTISEDGYYVIGDQKTTLRAVVPVGKDGKDGANGKDGKDGVDGVNGQDGHSPVLTIDGGYWYVDGVNTEVKAEGVDGATPTVSIDEDGYWVVNGEKTNVKALGVDGADGKDGKDGADGHAPVVTIENGYWYIDGENTGVKAQGTDGQDGQNGKNGKDGRTPVLTVVSGYWCVDGVSTGVKAQGANGLDGTDGIDGHSPVISLVDGYWYVDGVSTGVKGEGVDGNDGSNGHSPVVSIQNGYWYVDGVSTGVKAEGVDGNDGSDGHSPVVSIQNGYWYVDGVSTGVKAEGVDGNDGSDGHSPVVSIQNGYWYVDGVSTGVKAEGVDGNDGSDGINGIDGKSVFELYVATFGFDGTEEEWLAAVTSGTLGVATARTITYDYNGAERGENPASVQVADGRCISLPTPERTGYDFLGWFTGNGVNDGQWTDTTVISSDMTLVARWKQLSFTVRFVDKDDVLLKEESVLYGEDANPPVAPAVASYLFSHWNGETTFITQDKVLAPVYVAQRYTVAYDTDGGNAIQAASYLFTETPVEPITPQKSGYVFDKWINAQTEEEYAFDAPLAGDTTLRAVWTDTVKIYTADDLIAVSDNLTAKYSLANDIDLDGAEWTPLGEFSGVLDGDGHKIHNFLMTISNAKLAFVQTNSGTIRNVTFEDVIVNNVYENQSTDINTAVVVAENSGTLNNVTVTNVQVNFTASIKNLGWLSYFVSVLAGDNKQGAIEGCAVSGNMNVNVTGNNAQDYHQNYDLYVFVGGVAGWNGGEIVRCKADLTLDSKIYASGGSPGYYSMYYNLYCRTGGIAGLNTSAMSDSSASVQLTLLNQNNNQYGRHERHYGGIVGSNSGTVDTCLATGTITSTNSGSNISAWGLEVGGIVGYTEGTVNDVFSDVTIVASSTTTEGNVGGIAGKVAANHSVTNALYCGDPQTTNVYNAGGLVGNLSGALTNSVSLWSHSVSSGCWYEGNLVAENASTGIVNKCLYVTIKSYALIHTGSGTATNCYEVTESNKNARYSEDFLYGENILSMDVWGVCDGLSVYLKAFCCETHDYGDTPACLDRYCENVGCTYAVKASEEHAYTDYVYNDDASCEADGTETAECANGCGHTHTRVKASSATGHAYSTYVKTKDATCTENAEETASCDNGCGDTHTREIANTALGHYYVQGKCVRCGIHSPALLTALSTVGYYHVDMDKDGTYSLNDYLYFGYYPQTLKKASVTVDEEANANGYYDGDDGYEYAKVTATPNGNNYTFGDGTAITNGNVYYFRVEPIRWHIKSFADDKALLVSELILDAGSYQDLVAEVGGVYYNTTTGTPEDTYANNYKYSRIRAWLNDNFYNTAFSALQKSLVVPTTVANGAATTASDPNTYACDDTNDNVFLPSYQDMVNAAYGFSTNTSATDARIKLATDYTIGIGGWLNTERRSGYYMTRSPYQGDERHYVTVSTAGRVDTDDDTVDQATAGILPALYIDLSAE